MVELKDTKICPKKNKKICFYHIRQAREELEREMEKGDIDAIIRASQKLAHCVGFKKETDLRAKFLKSYEKSNKIPRFPIKQTTDNNHAIEVVMQNKEMLINKDTNMSR
jgi:hypothetical protein